MRVDREVNLEPAPIVKENLYSTYITSL